jgi:hypothetical protein
MHIDVISAVLNAQDPIWVTYSGAASEGKKTDEGTIMSTPESLSKPVAVANPPEAQTPAPARIEDASDILTNCKI